MRRSYGASLVAIVLLAVLALGATLASGRSPRLGLDLRGGESVVLRPKTHASSGALNKAIEIIRKRVDSLGVAEPEITRQGSNIVIQLPGVKDPKRALELVGTTAKLYFRPVLQVAPPASQPGSPPTTPPGKDDPTLPAVLPQAGAPATRYELGPSEINGKVIDGTIISGADAAVDPNTGEWLVNFTVKDSQSSRWDDLARQYLKRRVAIDLDGEVKSAPEIEVPAFNGHGQISGNFTHRQAKDLALVLRYGSLPIELERQAVQTVSATLGKDSLSAGLTAGIIGLIAVALYMLLYYRALGLVVVAGLGVSGALMYAIVTYLGQQRGLALTLSGATGIIVSVGVTVDSYVVYFERLKDEIRAGRTIRTSVDRGFARAYRTILAADAVSFIGALLLYLLSVGAVRGFAFFLGLSTILDVVTAYTFTRPAVILLGRNRVFTEARWLGVARGLAAAPAGSPA